MTDEERVLFLVAQEDAQRTRELARRTRSPLGTNGSQPSYVAPERYPTMREAFEAAAHELGWRSGRRY